VHKTGNAGGKARGHKSCASIARGVHTYQSRRTQRKEVVMSTILLVILILILIGALPTWPYSSGWGYYPSGGLLILLIVIILALTGRL
jgi:uncharacterized integral membrane protein